MLEPVTQAQQSQQLDLLKVQLHVNELLTIMCSHRENCEQEYGVIHKDSRVVADVPATCIKPPRVAGKLTNGEYTEHLQ